MPTDEGGHYVAHEFGGPSEDFNHFAQDANFNRSEYRKLEVEWKKLTQAGQKMTFAIYPVYPAGSRRPSSIVVKYSVSGIAKRKEFPNASGRKR